MTSPTGRLNPMEPEMQFIPIQPNPQEEEYLQGRSLLELSILALSYGLAIEEFNKHFIENGPDFSRIERRVQERTLDLGFTEHGEIAHILDSPYVFLNPMKALCGELLVQSWEFPEKHWPRICKHCWKKHEKSLAHIANP